MFRSPNACHSSGHTRAFSGGSRGAENSDSAAMELSLGVSSTKYASVSVPVLTDQRSMPHPCTPSLPRSWPKPVVFPQHGRTHAHPSKYRAEKWTLGLKPGLFPRWLGHAEGACLQ